jgi:hypothetical protein
MGDNVIERQAPQATEQPDSIGIAIPRQWNELPVERAQFDRFCTEAKARWVEAEWDRTTQRRAELLLNRIRGDLLRHGVQFVAVYLGEPTDDDRAAAVPVEGEDEAAQDVLMASCTVGTYTKEVLGARADLTLGNLVMAFGRKHKQQQPQVSALRFKSITNLEPPILHDLPIGRSVRLRRLYELLSEGFLPQRFYGETYLTPLAGEGGRCTITHFTTPNLGLAPVFSELFEKIAATLTFWTPDDETSFESEWVDTFDG